LGISTLAIISSKWRDNLTYLIGIQQTLLGLGFILGPLVGALLIEIGGFGFVFYTFTSMFLVGLFFAYFLLSQDEEYVEPEFPITWKKVINIKVKSI
jgi:MFS family permease